MNGTVNQNGRPVNSHTELSESQWEKLQTRVLDRCKKLSPLDVFGAAAADGAIYRWGVAVAQGGPCGDLVELLSRLAVDERPKKSLLQAVDLPTSAEVFMDSVTGPAPNIRQCSLAVLWGAALPSLISKLDSRLWWELLGTLQQLRESMLQLSPASSPANVILGGELGLTLAYRLADLPSCKRLAKSSVAELDRWFAEEADALSAAVSGATNARLVLASVIRCQRLLSGTRNSRLKKRQFEVTGDLVVWTASLTEPGGVSAFSTAKVRDVRDDVAANGLLRTAVDFDPETLKPAISAALGESKSHGRLAWKVTLPESMHHDEDAKLAIMLPEWDVRRGRMHVDYSGENVRLELFSGKHKIVHGDWQVMLEVDGEEQHPTGAWTFTCEYTDDDVHYVELEQLWSGGLAVQRQCIVIREDRCVLVADTVVSSEKSRFVNHHEAKATLRKIRYTSRLPVSSDVQLNPEAETREVILADKKPRAMVIPLSANEWRVGPTAATLECHDQHLVLQTTANNAIFAPLWFDLEPSRYRRPRTWRTLTIVDELRLVRSDEAVGHRVQMGSEQWLVYRSLGERRCRSILGKHIIVDFFCGRFDPEDGDVDELVTVDDADGFDE